MIAFFLLCLLSGNDLVDEEVDIGGNDLPISSFPPVEIEKDTALRNAKRSSSSSSSGDSGSSSSGLCYCEPFLHYFLIKFMFQLLGFETCKHIILMLMYVSLISST